jgi:hypothetical protein
MTYPRPSLFLTDFQRLMRLLYKTTCIFLLICIVLCLKIQAQSEAGDTSISSRAYGLALRQYHDYLDPEPNLYRGGQYAEYGFLLKDGHPFFGEDRLRKGTVVYNGILYENVALLYDEVQDQPVTPDPLKVFKIALILSRSIVLPSKTIPSSGLVTASIAHSRPTAFTSSCIRDISAC